MFIKSPVVFMKIPAYFGSFYREYGLENPCCVYWKLSRWPIKLGQAGKCKFRLNPNPVPWLVGAGWGRTEAVGTLRKSGVAG